MKLSKIKLLFLVATVAFSPGCISGVVEIVLRLPEGFTGRVDLVLDQEDGFAPNQRNKTFTYTIPINGTLHVSSFYPFDKYRISAVYPSGETLPGARSDVPPEVIAVRGGFTWETLIRPPTMTFVIGSESDFDAIRRSVITGNEGAEQQGTGGNAF